MRLISNGPELEKLISRLVSSHSQINFAVAWASSGTSAFEKIAQHRESVRSGVIGTHFYQTHPDVLDEFVGCKNIRFVLQPQGIFHPKVYSFETDASWEILIGSANLTQGAFTKNSEVMLHFTNEDAASPIWEQVKVLMSGYWEAGEVVTQETAASYRDLWKAQQPALRRVSANYGDSGKFKPPVHTEIMSMPWAKFFSAVKADPHHGFSERCDLLVLVQSAFRDTAEFSDMPLGVRKTIAGLPNDYNDHWAWFGSMRGAGYYHQAVNNNDPHISKALSQIPLDGGVTERHYQSFIQEFVRAFPKGGDGVGVASRLLAMKRPDYFVCIDAKNRTELCKDFEITQFGMNYDRYWNEVICPIMDSVWWNTPVPANESQMRVWGGRAAMLDALFYRP